MLAAGIKTPVPLEELEIHLRDTIDRQVRSGVGVQGAFEMSVKQIGRPNTLEREFNKIERDIMTNIMKRIAAIALGTLNILLGTGFILDALTKHKNLGIWNYEIAWPIAVGIVITLTGISAAVFGFKRRKA